MEITSQTIYAKLREKYPIPAWVLIPELKDGTGWAAERTIDAYVISCWAKPGVGYTISYEIKVDRQDFMREIKDPAKREHFIKYSNEFFFITPPGLVKPDEVPAECGLLECGKKFAVKKIAQQRKIAWYPPRFIASIARKLTTENKGEDIENLKLFKYAGQDLTHDDLEKILKNEMDSFKSQTDRECRKTARENMEKEDALKYDTLVKEISAILKDPYYSSYLGETVPAWQTPEMIVRNFVRNLKDHLKSNRNYTPEEVSEMRRHITALSDRLGKIEKRK